MRDLHRVRAVALTGFFDVARNAGLDPGAMLQEAGLGPGDLENPESRLPASSVARLLETCAARAGSQTFVIGIAERRTFESLGSIAPLLERQNSVRQAIATTTEHRDLLNDVFEIHLHEATEPCFLEVRVLPQFAGAQPLMLTTAMTHVLLRGASHSLWKPTKVCFAMAEPEDGDRVSGFFGCPAEFGSRLDGFEVHSAMLDRKWDEPSETDDAAELLTGIEARIGALRLPAQHDETLDELHRIVAEIRSLVDEQVRA